MKTFGRWLLIWLLFLVLIFCLLALHLNNFFYTDDFWPILFARMAENPYRSAWGPFYGQTFWRPLPILYDVVCLDIFGLDPRGWHLLDLFLHSFNSVLVCGLVYLLLPPEDSDRRIIYSIFAGALFAVHPIGLLTAAWVACRADLLAAFFGLLSLVLALRALGAAKWKWLKIIGAMVLSFPAFLSKETALILPGFFVIICLFSPGPKPAGKRFGETLAVLLMSLAVLGLYLLLRFHMVGFVGGYEHFEFSSRFLLPRLSYHLPRVLSSAFRDYFFWRLQSGIRFWLPLILYLLIGMACLAGISQRARLLAAGLLWMLLDLTPLWNLSQMLFFGEARLLYFGQVGLALLIVGALAFARTKTGRWTSGAAFGLVLAFLAATSFQALQDFSKRCAEYLRIKDQTLSAIGAENSGNYPRRIYIMGLGFDSYYVDPMFKVYRPEWLDRMVVPGDKPGLAWVKKETALAYEEKHPWLPEIETHYSETDTALVAVTPPADLPFSVTHDQQCQVLEWKAGKMENITADVIKLFREREFLQDNFQNELMLFPSYEFRKRNYPLDWKLSPGLILSTPLHLAELYTLQSVTDDPYLISPAMSFSALATAELKFALRIQPKAYLAPQQSEGCFFWTTNENSEWKEDRKLCFPVEADGKFHTYRLRVDQNLYWLRSGKITRVRLDPIAFPGWFQLDTLVFSPLPGEKN